MRRKMVSRLLEDMHGLPLFTITLTEYETKGKELGDAFVKAEKKLARRFKAYGRTGPEGGRWIDNCTLVGLIRAYHFDVAILNPDGSWTVLEETSGQTAPYRAHVALAGLHYRPLRRATSDGDLSSVASAPVPFLDGLSAQLDQRRARLQGVVSGNGLVSALDPIDRLAFAGSVNAGPAATRATAQGLVREVAAAQDRLALGRPPPLRTDPVASAPARRKSRGSASKQRRRRRQTSASPEHVEPLGHADPADIDALVDSLMTQARAVPSVSDKWRACLQRDLTSTEDDTTKKAISGPGHSRNRPAAGGRVNCWHCWPVVSHSSYARRFDGPGVFEQRGQGGMGRRP